MQNRINLADSFDVCTAKLAFVVDALSQDHRPNSPFQLTERGQNGLAHILTEVRDELIDSTDKMVARLQQCDRREA